MPIEKAAGRPNVSGTAQYIEFVKQSSTSFTAPRRSLGLSADIGVPIYSGGAVKNAVKAAETRVEAGQADLRGTESAIFSQTVAAYMDVIRGEALVGLTANQVDVLRVNAQATGDRFEIGDLTRTDVAQSQARLALAEGDLQNARSNLINAREEYIRLTGMAPDNLQPPPPLPGLPASVDQAVATALDNNPDLIAARERADASHFDIDVAGASRLPRVSIFTGGDYSNYLGTLGSPTPGVSFPQTSTAAQAGVQVTIPIYQGGRPAALQRQAQARSAAAQENVVGAERDVIAQVRSAWASWQAANAIIASNQSAVDAAALSLEGVRAESTRRQSNDPRHPQCRAGAGKRPRAADHGAPQRLCRRLQPAGRHGPGRGAGPGAGRRRAAVRSAAQLRPGQGQVVGLVARSRPRRPVHPHR